MSQNKRIIAILERDGKIDNFQCIHNHISLRLGARIWDLKRLGWQFRTEELSNKNTFYHVIAKPTPKLF